MKEQWYFVELPYGLNPQNKLQSKAQDVLRKLLHRTVTDNPNIIAFGVRQTVKKLCLEHHRCKPLTVTERTEDNGTWHININDNLLTIHIKPIRGNCWNPPENDGKPMQANFIKLGWKYE